MERSQDDKEDEDVGCWLAEELNELDLNKSKECADIAVFTVISEGNMDQREYARDEETIFVVTDLVVKMLMVFSKKHMIEIMDSLRKHLKDKDESDISLVNHCVLLKQFRLEARSPKNKDGRTELVLASELVEFLDTYEESQSDQTELIWYDEHSIIKKGMKRFNLPVSSLKRVETSPSVPVPIQESSSLKNVDSRDQEVESESDRACNTDLRMTQRSILSPSVSKEVETPSIVPAASKSVNGGNKETISESHTTCDSNSRISQRCSTFVSTVKQFQTTLKVPPSSPIASTSKNVSTSDESTVLVSIMKTIETPSKTVDSQDDERIPKSDTTSFSSSSFIVSMLKPFETPPNVPTPDQNLSCSQNADSEDERMTSDSSFEENYKNIINGDSPLKDNPVRIILKSSPLSGKVRYLVNGVQLKSPNFNLTPESSNSEMEDINCTITSSEETGTEPVLTRSDPSQGFQYRTPERLSTKEQSSSKKRPSEDTVSTTCRKVMTYMKHKKQLELCSPGTQAKIDSSHNFEFLTNSTNKKQTPSCTVTSNRISPENDSEELILEEPQTKYLVPRVRRVILPSSISTAPLVESTVVTVSHGGESVATNNKIDSVPQNNQRIESVSELHSATVNSHKRGESNRSLNSVSTQTDLVSTCHDCCCQNTKLVSLRDRHEEEECRVSTSSSGTGGIRWKRNNESVPVWPNKTCFPKTIQNVNDLQENRQCSEAPVYKKPIKKQKQLNSLMQLKLSKTTKTNLLEFINKCYVEEVHDEMTLNE